MTGSSSASRTACVMRRSWSSECPRSSSRSACGCSVRRSRPTKALSACMPLASPAGTRRTSSAPSAARRATRPKLVIPASAPPAAPITSRVRIPRSSCSSPTTTIARSSAVSPQWPEGRFSTLAGFVEPGESLDDAVRREVMEEVGIQVGEVTYASSQPWPFPSSLMLGFFGKALSTDITIDENEIAEARWFTREEVTEMTASTDLLLPRTSRSPAGCCRNGTAEDSRTWAADGRSAIRSRRPDPSAARARSSRLPRFARPGWLAAARPGCGDWRRSASIASHSIGSEQLRGLTLT